MDGKINEGWWIMLEGLIFGVDLEQLMGGLKGMFYFLIVWIIFDIVTGLLRAMKDRVVNSSINYDGLIRKAGELVGVVFLTFVDLYLDTSGLLTKTGVGLLILYESISIIENFKQIGVNFDFLMKYFDEEKYKGDKKHE